MSIAALPAEILQKIFDYLPRSEQLQKTRISHRWNELVLRETYLILAYGDQLISERILRRTARGYCCFSVEFSESYEEIRSRLAICAQKFALRKLILDGIQTYALVSFVGEYRGWLRSLVQLSVTVSNRVDSSETDVRLDLPRLRILSWTYNTEGGSTALPVFRLNAPLLEDAFVECVEVDRTPLVLENTGRLKSLGLFVPKMVGSLCPDGLYTLNCLRLYNSTRPFEWGTKHCKLPLLTTLELCGCIVNSHSLAFIRNFPKLETLVIQTEQTNPINLSVIANSLSNLKQLRLFDVKYTHGPEVVTFPSLQILDINDIQGQVEYGLEINAPHLMTLKGTNLNLNMLELTNYATVRSLIIFGLYLNFPRPRLFESVMILYLDVPCIASNSIFGLNPPAILLSECLHQFPNLTRLTVVLHDKRTPVNISGFLLAVSFVNLRYLHLRDFDLDYNFLVGIKKANKMRTLVLQDGALSTTADNQPLHFSELQHFFVRNVKIPKNITVFPVLYPSTDMILSLADGNVFSTHYWDESVVKSREDYLTYLRW
ncbi:uncharacterized protein LOC131683037 [Topomyia yanbarensis]|uniref:uncharacterized protein LOC131683037 n=1 Tax=Topomyia yanbarensis TaxID=2498891 RepID=UPI00273CA00D|nr:uncharacterized protein LOC131683037 [Topomyia yanbarensis]